MLRFSKVMCPVGDESAQDQKMRAWHSMRYWTGDDSLETGFELASGSVYSGDLSPVGAPHGSGRLISGDQDWEYSGDFKAGKPAGQGSMKIAGTLLEGEFEDERLVEGSCSLPSGIVYHGHTNQDGEWTCEHSTIKLASKSRHQIRVNYPGGECYKGDVRNGMPHGVGTRTMVSGRQYHGQFMHGCRHGTGRMVLATGENMQASFMGGGKLCGEVSIALNDDGEIAGHFDAGKLQGKGLYKASNGVVWRGQFADSTLSGYAQEMTCPAEIIDGKEMFPASKYQGAVEDNRAHGEGEVTFGTLQYQGSWVNGQPDGQGKVIQSQVSLHLFSLHLLAQAKPTCTATAASTPSSPHPLLL
jgi:hypothetical protein